MKSVLLKRISTLSFVLIFLFSCHEREELPLESGQLTILESNTEGCKENLKSVGADQYVELKAESQNHLRVKFVNAIFNCCPGEIISTAFIEDDVLKVVFSEETGMCDCICEYDVECVVGSMENRNYNIEIYINGIEEPDAKLSFTFSSRLDIRYNIDKE